MNERSIGVWMPNWTVTQVGCLVGEEHSRRLQELTLGFSSRVTLVREKVVRYRGDGACCIGRAAGMMDGWVGFPLFAVTCRSDSCKRPNPAYVGTNSRLSCTSALAERGVISVLSLSTPRPFPKAGSSRPLRRISLSLHPAISPICWGRLGNAFGAR